MKKLLAVLIVAFLATNHFAKAQDAGLEVTAGLSIPTGNFGETDIWDGRYGNSSVGLALGLKKYFPLSNEKARIYTGFDFLVNPYSREAKEEYESFADWEIGFPVYLNVPINGGIEYQFNGSEDFKAFVLCGINLNIQKLTNFKASNSTDEFKQSFKPSTRMGLHLGGGIILQNNIKIGATYYILGKNSIKEEKESDISWAEETTNLRTNIVSLYASLPLSNFKK